jgi:hypothetical protein
MHTYSLTYQNDIDIFGSVCKAKNVSDLFKKKHELSCMSLVQRVDHEYSAKKQFESIVFEDTNHIMKCGHYYSGSLKLNITDNDFYHFVFAKLTEYDDEPCPFIYCKLNRDECFKFVQLMLKMFDVEIPKLASFKDAVLLLTDKIMKKVEFDDGKFLFELYGGGKLVQCTSLYQIKGKKDLMKEELRKYFRSFYKSVEKLDGEKNINKLKIMNLLHYFDFFFDDKIVLNMSTMRE